MDKMRKSKHVAVQPKSKRKLAKHNTDRLVLLPPAKPSMSAWLAYATQRQHAIDLEDFDNFCKTH
jgi:hypothetical protein